MSSDSQTTASSNCGILVVVSGPSGAGKTSICNELLRRLPDAIWSVSITTRPRRPGEVDGQNYRFVTRKTFHEMRDRGDLLESAEYVGNWYGTPRAPVQDALAAGKSAVLEIDVQGGMQVATAMPDSVRVFVLPPTRETLEARLLGRRTESTEQLKRRLEQADGEIAVARDSRCYQYFVTNDVLEDTVHEMVDIIQREVHAK